MNKEFIPYEQALELKELGFDEKCICAYFHPNIESIKYPSFHYCNSILLMGEGTCTGPLYQQAFRWFREKGIVNSIRSHNDKCHEYYLIHNGKAFQSYHSSTYEQAELECLNHLIRLFNQNK